MNSTEEDQWSMENAQFYLGGNSASNGRMSHYLNIC